VHAKQAGTAFKLVQWILLHICPHLVNIALLAGHGDRALHVREIANELVVVEEQRIAE